MLTGRYRNEWKYLCSRQTRVQLYERLRQAFEPDEHAGPDGSYTVHSLYFDDHQNSCAWDNEAGAEPRAKYRIRCYGSDLSALHLERKEKNNRKCRKFSCPISQEEYLGLKSGNMQDVFWLSKEPLVRRFCASAMMRGFSPKLALDYERTALIDPALNIRITFDSEINAADSDFGYPIPSDCPQFPLLSNMECVMEVKFDDILPGWLHQMISSVPVQQVPFSKYYLGMKKIKEVYR